MLHEFPQALTGLGGIGEQPYQIVNLLRLSGRVRQQCRERRIDLENPAILMCDHDRQSRILNLATYLVELILGEQHAHGAELHHHVAYGIANQARGSQVGLAPRVSGTLDKLMPL
jgi:hypothetical protein